MKKEMCLGLLGKWQFKKNAMREAASKLKFRAMKLSPAPSRDAKVRGAGLWLMIGCSVRV